MNYLFITVVLLFGVFENCRNEDECFNVDEDGSCLQLCPEGTFAYNPGCENLTMSQRTCRQPEPKSMGYICDISRCDCLEQKYWDEAANRCVLLQDCSDQSHVDDEKMEPSRSNK